MHDKHNGNAAIEIAGLKRYFGKTRAVDGIDLTVRPGGVYGILGPNGAGKTTLIRMLATLLKPDSGSAKVLGYDIVRDADAVRSRVSLTGQFASVDEDLSGYENLVLIARLYGLSRKAAKLRANDLLEGFGIAEAANKQVKTYSGGMRRRIDIAASIVVTPELLFLDEPTTGLDPRSRNQVWDIVRTLVDDGTTVLLTTQYLDEADQLAERIAVVDHGKIIAEGTPSQLKSSVGAGTLRIRLEDPGKREEAEQWLISNEQIQPERATDPFELKISIDNPESAAGLVSRLSQNGIVITGFSLGQPSLDEVFLSLTGKPAEESGDAVSNENIN